MRLGKRSDKIAGSGSRKTKKASTKQEVSETTISETRQKATTERSTTQRGDGLSVCFDGRGGVPPSRSWVSHGWGGPPCRSLAPGLRSRK